MLERDNDGNGDIWQDSTRWRFHGDGQRQYALPSDALCLLDPVSPLGPVYVLILTTWQCQAGAKLGWSIGTPPMPLGVPSRPGEPELRKKQAY